MQQLVAVFVFGVLIGGLGGWSWTDDHWQARTASANAAAVKKARETEQRNARALQEQEQRHEESRTTINLLADDNRRLARLVGMRDPGRTGVSPATGAAGCAADAAAANRLSAEAEEFLLAYAKQCDEAAEYAIAGHDYAARVNHALSKQTNVGR